MTPAEQEHITELETALVQMTSALTVALGALAKLRPQSNFAKIAETQTIPNNREDIIRELGNTLHSNSRSTSVGRYALSDTSRGEALIDALTKNFGDPFAFCQSPDKPPQETVEGIDKPKYPAGTTGPTGPYGGGNTP